MGARHMASSRANLSRTRAGTAVSPMPGMTMTIELMRKKTSPAAQTCAAVALVSQGYMPAIRAAIWRMKVPISAPISGRNSSSETKIARIFGA